MDQFNGIRAKTRRKRDALAARSASRRAATALLALTLAGLLAPRPGLAAGGHDAPSPAAATAPAPPPPAPPPPRKPPPDVRPPIAGPIAGTAPKPRIHYLADPISGMALGGFDPILYFLDNRPGVGDSRWQLDWSGTTWLFRNEGNLAAFRDAPEVYAPLYGGHCAFAVAQGRPAEGSPLHHLIWRGHLLLFADAPSRVAFLTDPDRLFAEAQRRWPDLLAKLP